jgi:ankyrin repeat protein
MVDRCGMTVEAVEALLDAGADVNGVNSVGHTALIRAFWRPDPLPFLKLLLSRGADANVRSGDGRTALHRYERSPA